MNIDVAWENLKYAIKEIEQSKNNSIISQSTLEAAIYLFLKYSANKIINKIKKTEYPLKPTISWLIFEAKHIQEIPRTDIEKLEKYWEKEYREQKGPLITPPFKKT